MTSITIFVSWKSFQGGNDGKFYPPPKSTKKSFYTTIQYFTRRKDVADK